MKSTTIIFVLFLLLCGAMYFLGKNNGTTEIKASIINNQLMVQQMYVFTMNHSATTQVIMQKQESKSTQYLLNITNRLPTK